MRFHWGHGIFIFIVFFFVITAVFVIWSFRQDNSLVEENYYAKELKYQDIITRKNNTASLAEPLTFQQNKDGLWIHFPRPVKGKSISGNITVYRPSDNRLDFSIPIQPDTAQNLLIPASRFSRGKYILKLAWTMDQKEYYQEQAIHIP